MNMRKEEQKAEQQALQEKYLLDKYNKKYSGIGGQAYFTVFRVGDKFRHNPNSNKLKVEGLKGLERHNNRVGDINYADKSRSHLNRILIGTENMEEDVLMYLEGVKMRSNSVVARELILSGGNGFFNRMLPKDQELWIQQNVKFLKENFGENCVHAVLHLQTRRQLIFTL